MGCGHRSGDFFDGTWVCAHCYQMLYERPKQYGPTGSGSAVPQEITWQAPIAKSKDGTDLRTFLGWMVKRVRFKSLLTIPRHEALLVSLEALQETGERYGSPYSSWARADAKELVDEYVAAYWESCGGNN